MKKKQIISIIILIFIYFIAIKDVITLYYISGSKFSIFVSHIHPSLLPGIVLIELFFSFSLFVGPIIFFKDAYKESPPTKPPFFLSLWISGVFPILVIINNYISGFFLYSAILLICGFLLTLEVIRLNIVGVKRDLTPKEDLKHKHVIEGLCAYLEEYEYLRPPITAGISPYPLKMELKRLNTQNKLSFKHCFPELYNKMRIELRPIFENAIFVRPYNPPASEFLMRYSIRFELNLHRRAMQNKPNLVIDEMESGPGFSIIMCIFLSFFITVLMIKFLSLSDNLDTNIYFPISLFIIIFISIYALYVYMSMKNRRIWGKKCNQTIKNINQELITLGIELTHKNNSNPKDFPIKLRHNDYEGLEYEMKGKNSYICYFKLN